MVNVSEIGTDYILKAHSAQTVLGFQQRTNMETNKSNNWLGAITSHNYEAMCQPHGSQVINHMTRNKRKKKTCLVGWILYAQAHGKW